MPVSTVFFIMLKHVDKVKIPKINSSPSVFSLSLKEKEFGLRVAAHPSRATQKRERGGHLSRGSGRQV